MALPKLSLLVFCSGLWLVFVGSWSGFLQEGKGQRGTTQKEEFLGAVNTQMPPVPGRQTHAWWCCTGATAPNRSSPSRMPLGPVAKQVDKQPAGMVWGNSWCRGEWRLFRSQQFLKGRVAKTFILWQTALRLSWVFFSCGRLVFRCE